MLSNRLNKSFLCSIRLVVSYSSGSRQRVNVKMHLLISRLPFLIHCFQTSFEWPEIFCLNKLPTENWSKQKNEAKKNCVGSIGRRPGSKITEFQHSIYCASNVITKRKFHPLEATLVKDSNILCNILNLASLGYLDDLILRMEKK